MLQASMIIISGTNRPGSRSLLIARQYQSLLDSLGRPGALLSLEGLDLNGRTPALEQIEDEWIIPAEKFVFILPEYNGSFPGAIKTFMDMSRPEPCWYHKKALLTGISDGRAGNLRGLDHFTGVLHFLRVTVHPNKLPISVIGKVVDPDGTFRDPATRQAVMGQLEEFLNF